MQNKIPINNLFHFPIYRNPLLQGFKATASVFSRYIVNLLFPTKEELLTRMHNTENRDFLRGKLLFLLIFLRIKLREPISARNKHNQSENNQLTNNKILLLPTINHTCSQNINVNEKVFYYRKS